MRNIVGVQTLTLLVIAIVVGIPGRDRRPATCSGSSFAASLGVETLSSWSRSSPSGSAGVAFLVAGTVLGTVPATVAAATPTTLVLRAE